MQTPLWLLLLFLLVKDVRVCQSNPTLQLGLNAAEEEDPTQFSSNQHSQAAAHLRDVFKRTPLPWQQPPELVPPYAQHVNNLTALIECQRRPNVTWMTVFALTKLIAGGYEYRVLLNTLSTYSLLGRGKSYVVLAATETALATCMALRLPCYNATGAVPPRYLDSYIGGTWAKVFLCRVALRALPPDLNMHVSDHDVVYLKKLYPSIERFAAKQTFDIAGQLENYPVSGINTGVLWVRNNRRTHNMYDRWIAMANNQTHDQEMFMRTVGHLTYVQEPGIGPPVSQTVASLVRHNAPFLNGHWCRWCGLGYTDCWADDSPRHCEIAQRLYIHVICVEDKIRFMESTGLFFLNKRVPLALNYTAIAAAGLPCTRPNDTAVFSYMPMA